MICRHFEEEPQNKKPRAYGEFTASSSPVILFNNGTQHLGPHLDLDKFFAEKDTANLLADEEETTDGNVSFQPHASYEPPMVFVSNAQASSQLLMQPRANGEFAASSSPVVPFNNGTPHLSPQSHSDTDKFFAETEDAARLLAEENTGVQERQFTTPSNTIIGDVPFQFPASYKPPMFSASNAQDSSQLLTFLVSPSPVVPFNNRSLFSGAQRGLFIAPSSQATPSNVSSTSQLRIDVPIKNSAFDSEVNQTEPLAEVKNFSEMSLAEIIDSAKQLKSQIQMIDMTTIDQRCFQQEIASPQGHSSHSAAASFQLPSSSKTSKKREREEVTVATSPKTVEKKAAPKKAIKINISFDAVPRSTTPVPLKSNTNSKFPGPTVSAKEIFDLIFETHSKLHASELADLQALAFDLEYGNKTVSFHDGNSDKDLNQTVEAFLNGLEEEKVRFKRALINILNELTSNANLAMALVIFLRIHSSDHLAYAVASVAWNDLAIAKQLLKPSVGTGLYTRNANGEVVQNKKLVLLARGATSKQYKKFDKALEAYNLHIKDGSSKVKQIVDMIAQQTCFAIPVLTKHNRRGNYVGRDKEVRLRKEQEEKKMK